MQFHCRSGRRDSIPQQRVDWLGVWFEVDYITPFTDKVNVIVGVFVSIATYMFGSHWGLFCAYLLLNVIDWVTGWLKSAIAGKVSSSRGLKGIIKKVGYWIMIAIAFGMSAVFIEIGEIIEVDLGITILLGWFVLLSLIVNELRSILENFVEAGYKVPTVLTNGLEVVKNTVDNITGGSSKEKEDGAHDEQSHV